jgi:hypothetical protein
MPKRTKRQQPQPAPSLAAPREAREVLAATHGLSARGEEARRVAEALCEGGPTAAQASAGGRPPPERPGEA